MGDNQGGGAPVIRQLQALGNRTKPPRVTQMDSGNVLVSQNSGFRPTPFDARAPSTASPPPLSLDLAGSKAPMGARPAAVAKKAVSAPDSAELINARARASKCEDDRKRDREECDKKVLAKAAEFEQAIAARDVRIKVLEASALKNASASKAVEDARRCAAELEAERRRSQDLVQERTDCAEKLTDARNDARVKGQQLDALRKELAATKAQLDSNLKIVRSAGDKLIDLESSKKRCEEELAAARGSAADACKLKLDDAAAKLRDANEQLERERARGRANAERDAASLKDARETVEALSKEVASLGGKELDCERLVAKLRSALKDAEDKLDDAQKRAEQEAAALRAAQGSQIQLNKTATDQLNARMDAERERADADKQRCEDKLRKAESEVDELRKRAEAAKLDGGRCALDLANLRDRLAAAEKDAGADAAEMERMRARLAAAESEGGALVIAVHKLVTLAASDDFAGLAAARQELGSKDSWQHRVQVAVIDAFASMESCAAARVQVTQLSAALVEIRAILETERSKGSNCAALVASLDAMVASLQAQLKNTRTSESAALQALETQIARLAGELAACKKLVVDGDRFRDELARCKSEYREVSERSQVEIERYRVELERSRAEIERSRVELAACKELSADVDDCRSALERTKIELTSMSSRFSTESTQNHECQALLSEVKSRLAAATSATELRSSVTETRLSSLASIEQILSVYLRTGAVPEEHKWMTFLLDLLASRRTVRAEYFHSAVETYMRTGKVSTEDEWMRELIVSYAAGLAEVGVADKHVAGLRPVIDGVNGFEYNGDAYAAMTRAIKAATFKTPLGARAGKMMNDFWYLVDEYCKYAEKVEAGSSSRQAETSQFQYARLYAALGVEVREPADHAAVLETEITRRLQQDWTYLVTAVDIAFHIISGDNFSAEEPIQDLYDFMMAQAADVSFRFKAISTVNSVLTSMDRVSYKKVNDQGTEYALIAGRVPDMDANLQDTMLSLMYKYTMNVKRFNSLLYPQKRPRDFTNLFSRIFNSIENIEKYTTAISDAITSVPNTNRKGLQTILKNDPSWQSGGASTATRGVVACGVLAAITVLSTLASSMH